VRAHPRGGGVALSLQVLCDRLAELLSAQLAEGHERQLAPPVGRAQLALLSG